MNEELFSKGMNSVGVKLALACLTLYVIGASLPSTPYTLTMAIIADGLGFLGLACVLTATVSLIKTIRYRI